MDQLMLSALEKAANKLRNKIEGQDYFKVLLSIIFIKFLTEKTELDWNKFKDTESDSYDDFLFFKGKYDPNVTVIDKKFLWSKLKDSTRDELKNNLDSVFDSLEKYQPEYNNISIYKFSSSDVPVGTLQQIIEIIESTINFDEQSYVDIFGKIYEHFIAKYSTDAGRGGEFYTPHSIVNLMVAVTEGRISQDIRELKIYDPTMGSAGMLVQSLNYLTNIKKLDKSKLFFYGQELKNSTWKIAKMNFVLRGVQWNFGNKNDDTFLNDLFENEKFDVILSNPPFNLDFDEEDYATLRGDKRFIEHGGPVYGKGNANYNFFNHIISHLEEEGIAAVIMQPAAGKSSREIEIRRKYLEDNIVEAIISLPQNVFSNTSIASNIWIFSKKKNKQKSVLFLELQGETIKNNKQEEFSNETIEKVNELFNYFSNNNEISSSLKYSIVENNTLIEKFNCDLSVSNHVHNEEEIEIVSIEEIKRGFKEILEDSEIINEKIKKAIKLLD